MKKMLIMVMAGFMGLTMVACGNESAPIAELEPEGEEKVIYENVITENVIEENVTYWGDNCVTWD